MLQRCDHDVITAILEIQAEVTCKVARLCLLDDYFTKKCSVIFVQFIQQIFICFHPYFNILSTKSIISVLVLVKIRQSIIINWQLVTTSLYLPCSWHGVVGTHAHVASLDDAIRLSVVIATEVSQNRVDCTS